MLTIDMLPSVSESEATVSCSGVNVGDASLTTTTSSPNTATSVSLPTELWCQIINIQNGKSLEKLAFLWPIRNVSRPFKAEVENLIDPEYLVRNSRLMGIRGYLCKKHNEYIFTHKDFLEIPHEGPPHPDTTPTTNALLTVIPFGFSHFDETDPSKAIYTVSKKEQQTLRENIYYLGAKPNDTFVDGIRHLPQKKHKSQEERKTIFIGQARAGDGRPGQMDLTKESEGLEIMVDWRQMLTGFFRAQREELEF